MNQHEAVGLAHAHEESIGQRLEALLLPTPQMYLQDLRRYIKSVDDSRALQTKPTPLRLSQSTGNFKISQGPPILKPGTAGQLVFKNGSHLGFSLTLKPIGSQSRLVEASYSLNLPEYKDGISKFRPEFFRIHLEAATPKDPLQKSRSHFHPGLQHIHIPFPVMEPRAVLNLLIFEVMHHFTR